MNENDCPASNPTVDENVRRFSTGKRQFKIRCICLISFDSDILTHLVSIDYFTFGHFINFTFLPILGLIVDKVHFSLTKQGSRYFTGPS